MSKTNSKILCIGYKYTLCFCLLILSYILFGLLSYALPEKPIRKHIKSTVDNNTLAQDYTFAIIQQPQYQLDNFTDALILNQTYCMGQVKAIEAVMLLPRQNYPISSTENLKKATEDAPPIYAHYGRYWHGSTFFARFLMSFYDYAYVRILLYIFSSMLLVVFLVQLYKISNWITTLNVLVGFLIGNVFIMQFSMQFFFILALSLLGAILCIYKGRENKDADILFLIFGSLTNYFDLLTTPILSLGIMLVPTILFLSKQNYTFAQLLKKILFLSALWAGGYAFTFFAKWIIASLLCGENVLQNAFNQVIYRTSTEGNMWIEKPYSRWQALTQNTNLITWPYFCLCLIANCIYFVVKHFSKTNKETILQTNEKQQLAVGNLKTCILFLLIGLYPYLWYLMAANHSFLHWWFTYRGQIVSLICFLLSFQYLLTFIQTIIFQRFKQAKGDV